MNLSSKQCAFSLAEIMVALFCFSVAVLLVLALTISLTRVDRETVDRSAAVSTANRVLERVLRDIRATGDPISEADFWAGSYPASSPILTGSEAVGSTQFSYEVTSGEPLTALDTGQQIGTTGPNNRLKKVSVRVTWFSEDGDARAGYGRLEAGVSRLVREGEEW